MKYVKSHSNRSLKLLLLILVSSFLTSEDIIAQGVSGLLGKDYGISFGLQYPSKFSNRRATSKVESLNSLFTEQRFGQSNNKATQEPNFLFPNPTSKEFSITSAASTCENCRLSIKNNLGNTVLTEEWVGRPIDVSMLPPGLYTVVVEKSREINIQKLIVVH